MELVLFLRSSSRIVSYHPRQHIQPRRHNRKSTSFQIRRITDEPLLRFETDEIFRQQESVILEGRKV